MYHSAISLYSQKFHRPITYRSTLLSLTLPTLYAIVEISYRSAMRRRVGCCAFQRESPSGERGCLRAAEDGL